MFTHTKPYTTFETDSTTMEYSNMLKVNIIQNRALHRPHPARTTEHKHPTGATHAHNHHPRRCHHLTIESSQRERILRLV